MVSVEVQSAYWLPLRANPLTNFFIDFIDDKVELVPPLLNISDNDNVICNLLTYVKKNNSVGANSLYEKLTTRNVRIDSEWVHNDYLVFALICTTNKFHLDKNWIEQILIKRPNTETVQRMINKSFSNVLSENYNSRKDYHQIAIVCQLIIGDNKFNEERINDMFSYLWKHSFPYFESEFLNIISLRAIRAVFELKGLSNPDEQLIIKEFNTRFVKKSTLISKVVANGIFILTIVGLAVVAVFYAENIWIKGLLLIFSTLGIGASTFADVRNWLSKRIDKAIKSFWGYSSILLNRNE